jgi:hypothetical protein
MTPANRKPETWDVARRRRRRRCKRLSMKRIAIGLNSFAYRSLLPLLLAVAAIVVARIQTAQAEVQGSQETQPAATTKITAARVGLENHYKLGCWTPVIVEVAAPDASKLAQLRVEVTTADSDGVATTANAKLADDTSSNGPHKALLYTQVGRIKSPIRIALFEGDRQIDEIQLQPDARPTAATAVTALPATSELIVTLSATPFGFAEAFPNRTTSSGQPLRTLLNLKSIDELPTHWFGYDAVNLVVIAAGDGRIAESLVADPARMKALQRWIELGGRLVVFCGGQNAQKLLGNNGPLASLVPGKFADVISLPDARAIENFAGNVPAISGSAIQIPRLTEVDGNIESHAGQQPTDLPIVVRASRGFGEIAFVGAEFHESPLSDWPGRTAFLQTLMRPYLADLVAGDASQRMMTSGFNDLSGALRQQLSRAFSSVAPIGFPIVTGLVIAYLLVLGPLDYFLVNRWLRRPLAAWISFPLIVIAFSALALAVGSRSKGPSSARVNQIELVDVDTQTAQVRGTFWSAIYSPESRRYNPAIQLPKSQLANAAEAETLLTWWGLTGAGIGGMQAPGSEWEIIRTGYQYGPETRSLEALPVLESATKSLAARWTAKPAVNIEAKLSDAKGLVEGTLENRTGLTLRNVRLLYGQWAYRLGTLNADERAEIVEDLNPRKVRTIVTREALGESGATAGQVEGRVFAAERASAKDILNLMMFYNAAGGVGFAHLPNNYQAWCDLSRQLDVGRAILVAEVDEAGSQLIENSTNEPIGDTEQNTATIIYRFLLPV